MLLFSCRCCVAQSSFCSSAGLSSSSRRAKLRHSSAYSWPGGSASASPHGDGKGPFGGFRVGDAHPATTACPLPSPRLHPGRPAWFQGSPRTAFLQPSTQPPSLREGGSIGVSPPAALQDSDAQNSGNVGPLHSPQPARKSRSPENRQGGPPKGPASSTKATCPTVWPGVASASKVRQPTLSFSLSPTGLCRQGWGGGGGGGMVTSQNAQHSQNSPHRCWQGGEGDPDRWEDDCGTYWVSSGMASTALPYTLQEPCCWSSAAFPPLWSLQVSSSVHPQYGGHPISATLGDEGAHSPSTPSCPTPADAGFALGSPPRRASPTPPITVQLSSTPLPVFVCTEYSLQHHPLLFDGSLAGQKCRCMCMGGEHSSASSPPAPRALWVKD